jgi:hypothetical protein
VARFESTWISPRLETLFFDPKLDRQTEVVRWTNKAVKQIMKVD